MPVVLPPKVSCEIRGGEIVVSGPGGKLSWSSPPGVKVSVADGKIVVERDGTIRLKERELAARHGLSRACLRNMVEGVTTGFVRKLEMRGQGYRPTIQGNKLTLTLGFSKPVVVELPAGIKATAERIESGGRADERYTITLAGTDRGAVGELAACIRRIRKADAYKGKGIRYTNEFVRQKPGKATVATTGGGK